MEQSKTLIYLVAVLILLTAANLVIGVVNMTKSPVNTATPIETETPVVTGVPYGDDGLTGECSATRPCNGDFVCEAEKCVAVPYTGDYGEGVKSSDTHVFSNDLVRFEYPSDWYSSYKDAQDPASFNTGLIYFDELPIDLKYAQEAFFDLTVEQYHESPAYGFLWNEIYEKGKLIDAKNQIYFYSGIGGMSGDVPFEMYLHIGDEKSVVITWHNYNNSKAVWEEIKKTIEWK